MPHLSSPSHRPSYHHPFSAPLIITLSPPLLSSPSLFSTYHHPLSAPPIITIILPHPSPTHSPPLYPSHHHTLSPLLINIPSHPNQYHPLSPTLPYLPPQSTITLSTPPIITLSLLHHQPLSPHTHIQTLKITHAYTHTNTQSLTHTPIHFHYIFLKVSHG